MYMCMCVCVCDLPGLLVAGLEGRVAVNVLLERMPAAAD